MKDKLNLNIDTNSKELLEMSDYIFDNPELGLEEFKAVEVITNWLEKEGFEVERNLGDIETAFRATYTSGTGGPTIGFLTEYDALPKLGHACAHHMQSPAILSAAKAVKDELKDDNYKIVIYGTPAEESVSGKIMLIKKGFTFEELDVALMMHGSGATQVDIKSLALTKLKVEYKGINSHAAVKPEDGRSSLDAMILAFQGVEFLREHVRDDVKIHYNIIDSGGTPANIVPAYTSAGFYIRSFSRTYLDEVVERFTNILNGAALMTETEVNIIIEKEVDNKIPALKLNDIIMENAKLVDAPRIRAPREKTGSTDFGNVLHRVPGSCIRIAFVPEGTPAHTETFLEYGKTKQAHDAIIYSSKILASTAYDLIKNEDLVKEIKEEFKMRLEEEIK